MSDQINQYISNIREKSMLLHDRLTSEQQENQQLKSEIQELKTALSEKDAHVERLNAQVVELSKALESASEKEVTEAAPAITDQQIDELVKEIEYCITQLKK